MTLSRELEQVASLLRDTPAPKDWFVDREKEQEELERATAVFRGSVLGLTGERGVGKTSLLLRLYENYRGKKAYVRIFQRESVESIMEDLLIGLAKHLGKQYEALREEWQLSEMGGSLSISPSPSASLSASGEKRKKPVAKVVEKLRDMLEKEGPTLIILDELDKERYEELVKIMDALKFAFEGAHTTVVMALPPYVERAFYRSLIHGREVANTEGFLSHITALPPLEDKSLLEMLKKRLGKLTGHIEKEALQLALAFARGNPRRFLFVLREAILYSTKRVDREAVKKVLRRMAEEYVEGLGLTKKERALLSYIATQKGWERAVLIKRVVEKGIFKVSSNAYQYLRRLEEKGAIVEKEGRLFLSPFLAFLVKEGLIQI